MTALTGVSFSTSEVEDKESEEETEEGEEAGRKRRRAGPSLGKKMQSFFEGLMRQVMERQEAMQQRFLEVIEKRAPDRIIREEAWRRQDMARVTPERDLLTQERSMATSHDVAVKSYFQHISGQSIHLPLAPPPPQAPTPTTPTPIPIPPRAAPPPTDTFDIPPPPPPTYIGTSGYASRERTSSRWPKVEVLALIKLRSGGGRKGPLVVPFGLHEKLAN